MEACASYNGIHCSDWRLEVSEKCWDCEFGGRQAPRKCREGNESTVGDEAWLGTPRCYFQLGTKPHTV